MKDLDIVIPLYNSSKTISQLIVRLNQWIQMNSFSTRIIFVDDASSDDTLFLLSNEKIDFDFKLIKLAQNYGQHTATAVGLGVATAKLVATIDDDLQHDPFEINKLMDTLVAQNVDLVYGNYLKKKHSISRNLGTYLLQKFLLLFGLNFNNVTSFRLMKSNVAKPFKTNVSKIIFIDDYLKKIASKEASCTVTHFDRLAGTSNYTYWKLMKFSLKIIMYHSSIPLKIITRFGLIMSGIFFILGCLFIYNKMINNVPLGYTSIIVALFFSTGMIMMSLGIIGEYIRKIWISQNNLNQILFKIDDAT
jgi:undecaprenyl-phosphate 4-deoxy-4-formamido-L-arabinose transferase